MTGKRDKRLRDWKEIAAFFGRDERTVRRWERQRGLPVRRISGGARNLIFAYPDELERWLRNGGATDAEADAPQPPEAGTGDGDPGVSSFRSATAAKAGWPVLAFGAACLLLLAAGVFLLDRTAPAGRVAYRPDAKVHSLYLDAVYYLETRQANGLTRAMQLLTEATALDPQYAEAYVKLADTYNMVSQFTLMPARDAYPRALAAANRALVLDPGNAGAHAALAFTTFYWNKDFARSRELFEQAIALDPNVPQTHHWYALTLMVTGEKELPLREINRAQELNPQSRSILANKALILFYAGRVDEALAILQPLADAEPNLRSPPEYLATIYLDEGRWSDFLREYRTAARISGNDARRAIADAAERGLREGGGQGMLEAMYAEQKRQYENNREPAYKVAGTAAMLGRADEAIGYLEESVRRKEDDLPGMYVEPIFKRLRADPRYRSIVSQQGFVPAPAPDA